MIEPYRFANGETYGEPDRTPAPSRKPPPPRLSLGERARLAKRRREMDPESWAARSPESRRFLIELDAKEMRK